MVDTRSPVQVTFRALIKEGKFYTLDGEKEITAPTYAKFVRSPADLTTEEFLQMIESYKRQQKIIQDIKSYANQML